MMPERNTAIDVYIDKVTALQQSQKNLPTWEDLVAIARELGLTEEDIQKAKQESEKHHTRARGYMGLGYWNEAIEELQEAFALNPSSTEIVLCLGQAHLGRWKKHHHREDADHLHLRVQQCLSLHPDSTEALDLLAQFRKNQQFRRSLTLGGLGFFLALGLSSLGYLLWRGGLPFVIEEKNRIETLEKALDEQYQALEQLQVEHQEAYDLLRQEWQGEQSAQVQRIDRRLRELEQMIKALKESQESGNNPVQN